METASLMSIFLVSFTTLWVFLLVLTLYQTNTRRLIRKGYPEESFAYLKNSNIRRNSGIAVVVPLLGLTSAFIVWAVTGDLEEPSHMAAVLLVWLILIAPFPILDYRKSAREQRELALRTHSNIVVDFNFTILHLVFRPSLEALFSILYVAYFLLFIHYFHVAFVHVALLWALYGAARYGKNLTAPALRDAYHFLFVFIMLNQLLLLFHLVREWKMWYDCCIQGPWDLRLITGAALGIGLTVKLVYYLARFPEFHMRLGQTKLT
jgi:hypothetical protein